MMKRQEVSKECDVYSYSILLWEIITHKLPFSDVIPLMLPMAVVEGKVQCRDFLVTIPSYQLSPCLSHFSMMDHSDLPFLTAMSIYSS